MKRVVVILLLFVFMQSLVGCAKDKKSEAVLNVESKINSLNSSSTYKEIDSVYQLYRNLELADREKVENLDTLSEYCNPNSGYLALSSDMLSEINRKITEKSLLGTDLEWSVRIYFAVSEWSKYGDLQLTSKKKEDKYTYCVYGTVKAADKYGNVTRLNLKVTYRAEYSDEEECGYKIVDYVSTPKA